jgi:hypothetical protein
MKKGCLAAVAVAVVLAVLVLVFVFWFTGDAVKAADQFLAMLSEGKSQEAYQAAAESLRAQQSFEEFSRAVESMGLQGCRSASWSSREVQNDQASLEGSVTLADGGTLPLSMKLVKESGGWKVISLTTPRAGATLASPSGEPSIPGDDQLKALVHGTITDFARAVEAGDFGPFHQNISARWQTQITADQLRQVFGQFVDQKLDLSGVYGLDPVLGAPPSTSGEGLLVLSGFYPLRPQPLEFELKYIYEHPQWKLFGIHVNLGAPASPEAESTEGSPDSTTAVPPPTDSAAAYEIVENAQLAGRLGRLMVVFPQGSNPSSTRIDVFPAGQDKAADGDYGSVTFDLLPGRYDVVVSKVRLEGVEIQSRHDTRIKVGVLKVTAGSSTQTRVLKDGVEIRSDYGNAQFGLPAGEYEVEVSGTRERVTIGDGAIVEF